MGRRIDKSWLRRIGRPVQWEQAILRSGRRYDGATKFFEGEPEDRGYLYSAPKNTLALLTSDRRDESFEVQGSWEKGSCMMTFDADLEIGPQDRITFLDMPVRMELELERGAGDTDSPSDALAIEKILAVRDDGKTYTAGSDFRIERSNGLITALDWSAGVNAPVTGDHYGLLVTLRPRWIVDEPPMVRSFGAGKRNQLLKRCTLHREDRRLRT